MVLTTTVAGLKVMLLFFFIHNCRVLCRTGWYRKYVTPVELSVLYASKLIHFVLKNVAQGEKWGAWSFIYASFQIGSNFVPLLSMCVPLICDYKASTHYPPEASSTRTTGFQKIWWEKKKGCHHEYSVEVAEKMGTTMVCVFKDVWCI